MKRFQLAGAMLATVLSVQVFSQDIIVLDNQKQIIGKVKEITPHYLRYVKNTEFHGKLTTISKENVSSIIYQNGDKEVIRRDWDDAVAETQDIISRGGPSAEIENIYQNKKGDNVVYLYRDYDETSVIMANKGRTDARSHYEGYKEAKTWTLLTALLISPVWGLVPALSFSGTPPSNENLNYPNSQLMDNEDYRSAYINESRHIKNHQTWTGYIIGSVIWFVLIGALFLI